jgi:hypothetical protein
MTRDKILQRPRACLGTLACGRVIDADAALVAEDPFQ